MTKELEMSKRIFVVVLSLTCIALIFGNSGGNTIPVQASGPEGVFDSRFFKPNEEIISCTSPQARSQCADGTCSTSTGRGTCSHHGGVVGSVEHTSSSTSAEPPTTRLPINEPESSNQPVNETIESSSTEQASETTSPKEIPQSGGVLSSRYSPSLFVFEVSVLVIIIGYGVQVLLRRD